MTQTYTVVILNLCPTTTGAIKRSNETLRNTETLTYTDVNPILGATSKGVPPGTNKMLMNHSKLTNTVMITNRAVTAIAQR